MAQELNDALVVRIEASVRKFERQMEQARKAAVSGAQGAENAWRRGGKQIAANANHAASGLQRLANISGRGRFVLQNTANQIGDIAVQMQGGTSASRALSQQLPQLLGGFGALGGALGLLGPLLGTVAALGFPVATALLAASDEGRKLSDVVSDMDKALGDLEATANIGMMTMDELTERYGENAAAVREVYLELVKVNQQRALNSVQEAMIAAGDELGELEQGLRDFADARREFLRAQDTNTDGFAELLPSEIAALEQEMNEAMQRLQDEFGLTTAQVYRIIDALDALKNAKGPEEAAEAVRQISLAFSQAVEEGARLEGAFANIAQSAAHAFASVSRAMTVARNAADEAARMNSGTPIYRQGLSGTELLPPALMENDNGGGGGGARRGGSVRLPDGLHEAQRLYENTRTEAEKYAAEVERINELHRLFPEIVTDEVRDRALDALKEGVEEVSDATKTLESGFEDLFLSITEGADAAKSALAGLLSDMAKLLAQSAYTGLFGDKGLGGTILGGLGIPGYATGTNSAPGGLALVGERGTELVNLPRGSQVFSAEKTKQMLSGGGIVNNWHIDARGAQAGVGEEIRRALEGYGPTIDRRAVAAVSNARKRGLAV